MSAQWTPLKFATLADARRYVRRQLSDGLPEGWAAQWQKPEEPRAHWVERMAAHWRIATADAIHDGRLDPFAEDYDLLLTSDLRTFLITYGYTSPGVGHWSDVLLSARVIPVGALAADAVPIRTTGLRSLSHAQANLGDIVAYVIAHFPPNVYDLT